MDQGFSIDVDTLVDAAENSYFYNHLKSLYERVSIPKENRQYIDKKLKKINDEYVNQILGKGTVDEYFSKLWKATELKEKHKQRAVEEVKLRNRLIMYDLKRKEVKIANQSRDIDEILERAEEKVMDVFARKQRLKEAERRKKELEEKLKAINVDVEMLRAEDDHPLHHRYGSVRSLRNSSLDLKRARSEDAEDVRAKFKRVLQEKKVLDEKRKQREELEKRREEYEMEMAIKRYFDKKKEERAEIPERMHKLKADLKKAKEDRKKEFEAGEGRTLEIINGDKPLYRKMLQGFRDKEAEELQKKNKETLERVKSTYKPINQADFDELERRVEEYKKKREEEKKKEKEKEPIIEIKKPSYESNYHRMFEEENLRLRKLEEEKSQERRRLAELRQSYKAPEDAFVPSEKKRAQLQMQVENLRTDPYKLRRKLLQRSRSRSRSRSLSADKIERIKRDKLNRTKLEEKELRLLGNTYLDESRKVMRRRDEKVAISVDAGLSPEKASTTKDPQGSTKAVSASTSELRPKKKIDYLTEIRKKYELKSDPIQNLEGLVKEVAEKESPKNPGEEVVEKDSLNKEKEKAKRQKLKLMADQMLEQAAMKEKLLRTQSTKAKHVDEESKVDDMYISVIKAKLALLQDV